MIRDKHPQFIHFYNSHILYFEQKIRENKTILVVRDEDVKQSPCEEYFSKNNMFLMNEVHLFLLKYQFIFK